MAAIRWITYAVLGLGAVFTSGTMMWHAQWNSQLVEWLFVAAFMLWDVAPYFALSRLNALSKGSAAIGLISFVGSVAAVAYAVYVYVDIRLHPDAQGALVFIFIPLFQLAWAALLFVPWIFIAAWRRLKGRCGEVGGTLPR